MTAMTEGGPEHSTKLEGEVKTIAMSKGGMKLSTDGDSTDKWEHNVPNKVMGMSELLCGARRWSDVHSEARKQSDI